MIREEIRQRLFELQDVPYRDFQVKLIPTVETESMIGVRTPALRKLAREYGRRDEIGVFLQDLPHKYFDENQLHAFIISGIKDFETCIMHVEKFLPYVDNWATCDQMSPTVFKKKRQELLPFIREWMKSDRTYTVRFGIGMLMQHYLDEDFDPSYPEMVAGIKSEEYYISMMIAWYYATALVNQYDTVLPYIEEKRLDSQTHNRAIQKAVESYRITQEQKAYLKTLKIRK